MTRSQRPNSCSARKSARPTQRGSGSPPARTTSNVLPWITNIDVVPEKYSSASLPAHGGECGGSAVAFVMPSLPARTLASSVIAASLWSPAPALGDRARLLDAPARGVGVAGRAGPDRLRDVGREDRRRLVLARHAGDVLEIADGLLGLRDALGDRVDPRRHLVGIGGAERHLGHRLDLVLEAIELGADELGVALGLDDVLHAQLGGGEAVVQRAQDAIAFAVGLRHRGLALL